MTATGWSIGILTATNLLSHRVVPRSRAGCRPGPGTAPGIRAGISAGLAVAQVAGLAVLARRAGLSAGDLGLDRRRLGAGVRWGGGAVAAVAAGSGVLLALPAARAAVPGAAVPGRRLAARVLVHIPLTTVLPEEFAFRGVLTALLGRRLGPGPARVAVAGLFGCWHVLPGLAGGGAANQAVDRVVGGGAGAAMVRVGGTVLVTTAGGLLMGELGRRSGSLLAPVLLHWAINGCGELVAGRR